MGRLDGNSTPNNHPGQSQFQLAHPTGQQVEEYGFTPVTQAPETIDDAPPAYEFGNEETQRENSQNVPPEKPKTRPSNTMNTGLENQIQQKSQPPAPPAQPGEAVTFPPTSASQAVQFPPQNAQMPATRSTISGIPPQGQPHAFPPSEAFPPEKPSAFAPPGTDQIHGFPPHQGEPVHFPPHQPAFQQPHMAQFTPATNHSFPATNMNASMGSQGIPGSPFGQNGHMVNNFPQAGFPVQTPLFKPPTELWKSTLFDCMNDPENALITACFPCVTFGQIAEILDQGQTSCGTSGCLYGMIAFCIAMPCLMSCGYRTKIRNQFGLIESPAPDWIVHCFCEWCALCQEYRELKLRGLDPAIGWQGNSIRMQQQMATMTPPMQHMMGR